MEKNSGGTLKLHDFIIGGTRAERDGSAGQSAG
jgi:hypothetical protein